ncbi:MAG: AMP-binding protein, partial [Acidobacteriota bacterium]
MDDTDHTTSWFARLQTHDDRIATLDDHGSSSYRELLIDVERLAAMLDAALPQKSEEARDRTIAIDAPPSRAWIVAVLATWRVGGIAVPLAMAHPERELEYTLDDGGILGGSRLILATAVQAERLAGLIERHGLRCLEVDRLDPEPALDGDPVPDRENPDSDPALLLYTSGTTGRPKGVPLSHGNLRAQIAGMVEAWGWTPEDRIVELLPLHHLHGIVNVVLTALWTGATIRLLPRFDAERVWQILDDDAPSVLMAVPTIYNRLLGTWDAADTATRERWSAAAR